MTTPLRPMELKEMLSSVFRRKGSSGAFMRLYEDLTAEQQGILSKIAQLGEDELPILGSAAPSDSWFLLTTTRLINGCGGDVTELSMTDIKDATVDFVALQEGGRTKLDLRELDIITMSGKQHRILIESGAPFSGVWNVLRTVGARNRRDNEYKAVPEQL